MPKSKACLRANEWWRELETLNIKYEHFYETIRDSAEVKGQNEETREVGGTVDDLVQDTSLISKRIEERESGVEMTEWWSKDPADDKYMH